MKVKCLNWYKTSYPLSFYVSGYNEENKKCVVQIINYENEIFIEISKKNFTQQDLDLFINFLERNSIRINKARSCLVEKFSLYGYLPIFCYKIFIKRGFIRKTLIDAPFQYKIINEDIDERVKFCTDRGIKFCRWINLKTYETNIRSDLIFYKCFWQDVDTVPEEDIVNDLEIVPKIFYFDIECEELKNEDEEDEEEMISSDNIIQISIVCQKNDISIYLLSLFPVNENQIHPEGYEMCPIKTEYCKTQKSLLLRFFNILSLEDPDIISGYNILEFDWKRIISISEKNKISEDIYKKYISRSKTTDVRWISKVWESSAYAKKEFFYPEIEGRSNLDIIQHVKRNYRLSSYSLNNVVKTFLVNKSKLDVDYKVIKIVSKISRESYVKSITIEELKKKIDELRPYRFYDIIGQLVDDLSISETLDQFKKCLIHPMTVIGKYCIVDSLLCLELMNKLQIISACEEIANCTYVTLEDTLCRGNQYRIFNLLYNKCYFKNIVLNKPEGKFDKFNNELRGVLSGALVLDPVRGHHKGVITLDFASLYPNIIINYNLCYTTFSLNETSTTSSIKTREGEFYFEKEREGILPQLEKELIEQRKIVKKQLKIETKPFKKQILDSRQNALKITANSIYGALAAEGGRRLLVPVAACITSIGREMLDKVRFYVSSKGYEVIYGDTDSNIIKLPTSINPFIVHDSRIFTDELNKRFKHFKYQYDNGRFMFQDEEIEKIKSILKTEYSINLIDKVLNVSSELESRAVSIGKQLARDVTNTLNDEMGTAFDLEFENCFENYLLIGKKFYIGKKYSGELVKKGVLSVKRIYADIEKKIYDSVVLSIFNNNSKMIIETLVDEIQKIYTESFLYEYIITTSFKSLRNYASKIDTGIYIDREGGRFVTKDKLHPDMHFPKLPVNAMVALKMYNRGETCLENSRLEYVFYDVGIDKTSKGEMAIDFVYFYRNREFLNINKLAYLKRLINPIDKILDTSNISPLPIPSLYSVHEELSAYFHIKLPKLSDILSIKSDKRKYAISEVENILTKIDVRYSDLENVYEMDENIRKNIQEKVSISVSKKPVELFEKKLISACRNVIKNKSTHDKFMISICSTINSHYVLNNLYKKYKIRITRRKKTGICTSIVDIFEIKSNVIKELNYKSSLFI